jgi:hypothetical protein
MTRVDVKGTFEIMTVHVTACGKRELRPLLPTGAALGRRRRFVRDSFIC